MICHVIESKKAVSCVCNGLNFRKIYIRDAMLATAHLIFTPHELGEAGSITSQKNAAWSTSGHAAIYPQPVP